ncbi:phage head-tail connector protein [Staphylococcus equorum]|uniref:phage head-tail connector protein n=1 Tax=Staphylococcus equorum TaxID=246432 RepID=UPI002408531C|nr:phage head-tail connector protein [Staphylococcus equorum]MDG0843157.1 phage head-tail connector protein [Staphylococcus equorum]
MDAKDVKLLNQIPLEDTSNDEVFNQLIKLYKPMADDHCNQSFKDETLPSGVKRFIADCIKHGATGNLASRSMGTVSYSFVTDIPESMYKPLRPYRRVRWTGYRV